jgi:hypothetical protein
MVNALVLCILGVSARGTDANPPSCTITLTGTIVAAIGVALNVEQLDPSLPGVYKLVATYNKAHTEDAGEYTKSYLVADRFGVLQEDYLIARLTYDNNLVVKAPNFLVTVLEWPSNLSKNVIVASFKQNYNKGIKLAARNTRRK